MILKTVDKIVNQRGKQHGSTKKCFKVTTDFWNTYLKGKGLIQKDLTEEDFGVLMSLLKISRQIIGGGNVDNYLDAIGYLSIVGNLKYEKELKKLKIK